MNKLYTLIKSNDENKDKENVFKFLDDEKNIVKLYRIGGGGFASVDCYFNNKNNRYYALK